MKYQVNVAFQVLPTSDTKHPYDIVDRAIQIIEDSGLRYKVCPFETVMEGDYDKIMETVKKVQEECLEYGANSMLSYLKIQINKTGDVHIEDKTGKYEKKG